MKDTFYIPVKQNGDVFFYDQIFDINEVFDYAHSKFHSIIEEHFIASEGILRLPQGNFNTIIYRPRRKEMDVFFCEVGETGLPLNVKEIEVSEQNATEILKLLSKHVEYSEGIVHEQKASIRYDFIVPKIKFHEQDREKHYHYRYFASDCIIFGAPGSGKTTLLRRLTIDNLANAFNSENKLQNLPIYVQLRDFNNYSNTFETYINNCISNSFQNIRTHFDDQNIEPGRLSLFLDGADELDFEKFKFFKNTIATYKKKNPLISIIITSRPDKEFEEIEHFNKCYILPFSTSQVKEISYRRLLNHDDWKVFTSALKSVPDVFEVLKNPLLLTISHFLYIHKKILPINTGQLMKELVSVLISDWDAHRNIDRKYNEQSVSHIEIANILGKLAYIASEQKSSPIEVSDVFRYFRFASSPEELDSLLEYVAFATGLIQRVSEFKFRFVHKSIQDFLCSTYLVESLEAFDDKLLADPDREKVLGMMAGLSSDPTALIKRINKSSHLGSIEKILRSLSIYSESLLFDRFDIQNICEITEIFFKKFETDHKIDSSNIIIKDDKIAIKNGAGKADLETVSFVIMAILQLRFTKYEYDFFGYLKNSGSKILRSLALFQSAKGEINITSNSDGTDITHREVSSLE